jgi:nitrate reductase (NAD(P)H)
MMPAYHIGTLTEEARASLAEPDEVVVNADLDFLNPRQWSSATLFEKKTVSWDTRIFYFRLHAEQQTLGLPVGQHLMIRVKDPKTQEVILRPYTPISETSQKGVLEVLVKIYFDSPQQRGGKMTMAIDSLPLGEKVDFKGPIGKFEYLGRGNVSLLSKTRFVRRFIMFCGGSGITPIFQVLRAVCRDKDDPTECVVLNGNRLEEDILCKDELDDFQAKCPERCKIIHTLSKGSDSWTGLRGRIDKALIQEHVQRTDDTMVLICGPEPLEKAIHKALGEDGWSDDQIVFF